MAQEHAARLSLAAVAIGADGRPAETLAGMLDSGSHDAFARLGLSPAAAADRIAEVANAWLDSTYPEEPA